MEFFFYRYSSSNGNVAVVITEQVCLNICASKLVCRRSPAPAYVSCDK
jgi:hypothetical protein